MFSGTVNVNLTPLALLSISSLAIHLPSHQQWHSCTRGRSALRRVCLCACSLHKQNVNTKGSKATVLHSSSQQNVLTLTGYRPQLSTLHFRAAVLHFGTRHYYQVRFWRLAFPLIKPSRGNSVKVIFPCFWQVTNFRLVTAFHSYLCEGLESWGSFTVPASHVQSYRGLLQLSYSEVKLHITHV